MAADPDDAGAGFSEPDEELGEELESEDEDDELADPASGDAAEPDADDADEPEPLRLSVR